MIHELKLSGVGPTDELEIELQPRVNLIVGDNGLGKTFLLDVAWWVLSRSWASPYQALPRRHTQKARIEYVVDIKSAKKKASAKQSRC
ncbi:MAG: AAA family ATPase [Myxococcota bacterium]